MANPEHLAILKQGIEQWNNWRQEFPNVDPDLSDADLRLSTGGYDGADFRRCNLSGAKLTGTSLRGADLSDANLFGAWLSACDLTKCSLYVADLTEADCHNTDFSGADLRRAYFIRTNLAGAVLNGARIRATTFVNLDFTGTNGLTAVEHNGPSGIGVDTIYRSKGKIPGVFLQGCGVPEEVIELARSIERNPTEYYSCFISYSTKDQAFADRLFADLQAKGVRCWFAPHDIMGGRKIHEQIDEAIRVHDKLLLILSEHSMASEWVKTELAKALKREAAEKKRMLFPVALVPYDPAIKEWECFDGDRGKDSAREIREYYIPDFSGWERDNAAYQREFEKLVAALKSGATP
jgi:hypothetical protein